MFVSPLFLIAAGVGAVVPLLLHLMQNRRRMTMPFPTLRFVREARRQSSRRIRMEHVLLWLIRTLIMALIGLAFAMPMLRSKGLGWLGDAPRDVAIVIDASYSMGYNTGRDTVWDKAIDTAVSLVEGLGDNDRFCIHLAREQPEALVAELVGDKEEGVNRLKGLKPGNGSSQLAPAVVEALKALDKAKRRTEREVYILTDNQALAWDGFGEGGAPGESPDAGAPAIASWDPKRIGKRTTVFVALFGVSAPENVGPVSIDLQPMIVRPGSPAQVVVAVSRTGRSAGSTATLIVDGEQIGRRALNLESPDGSSPDFPLPPLAPGIHHARVETPDDNLPIDDKFHFLVRVEDQMPSLCVGTAEDTLFVRTALRTGAGPDSPPPAVISPDNVAGEALSGFSCIFLCNALPLTGQAIDALEQYARSGGLLVVFPGMRASLIDYQSWTCLPGIPTGIEDLPWSERRRTLVWDKPQHPIIRPLRQSLAEPVSAVRRRLAWKELHVQAERLVSMGAEQPFLLERPFGEGRVLMCAVSADRTWSDFPLSPFYLPLILQVVDYSAGFGGKTPFIWATRTLSLNERLPDVNRGSSLLGPDERSVPIRSAVVEGRTSFVAEDVTAPGIYNLSSPEMPRPVPALAVNVERRESDLTPLTAGEVADRMDFPKVQVALDKDALARLIQDHRIGRTYGEHLLWIALVLVIIEFYYANALLRTGPVLSEKLKVDVAGHLKGHAA